MHKPLNEKILIYKIQHGNSTAFEPLYDWYHEKIYRFVFLKVATAQDAEDITAETFLKCWHYIRDQKKVIGNIQALLYSIARNRVIDYYRRKGSAPIESLDDREIIIADRGDLTLEEKMALKTDLVLVERALRQLKDAYREVIILHYLNELSLKEAARIIGISPGAARVMLHRGLKALKGILAELGGKL